MSIDFLCKECWGVICQLLKVTKEFVITIVLSFLPIIFSSIYVSVSKNKGFLDSFYGNFNYGEAFLYTSAFLAPYLINRLREGASGLGKELCFYVFLYSLLMGTIVFFLVRTGEEPSVGQSFNKEYIDRLGFTTILATIFIWYYSIWPNYKKIKGFHEVNAEQIKTLDESFESKIGGNK